MNVATDSPVPKSTAPAARCFAGRMLGSTPTLEKPTVGNIQKCSLDSRLWANRVDQTNLELISTGPTSGHGNSLQCTVIGAPEWSKSDLTEIAKEQGPAQALLEAYYQYGNDLTEQIFGPFALAVIDAGRQQALLAVDRMGRFPLFYHANSDSFTFGSSAESVLNLAGLDNQLDSQGIYEYVYFHMTPSPSTIFEGIGKLQPGFQINYLNGDAIAQRYWLPTFNESSRQSRGDAHKQLKQELRESVKACIPESGKVGAFLSGGLDSSTVTGMLADLTDGPCDAYSIGFAAAGYDEMEYARITAQHFGVRLHEYYVTPDDVIDALPLIATAYDQPFGNSSALPAYFCAQLAADDGVCTLLAGDGGDELFAGNERYAKQQVFQAYGKLPAWLQRNVIEPLVNGLPVWIPLADKSRSYVQQAKTVLPDRLQTYNFLYRHAAEEIFNPEFLQKVDTQRPLDLQREVYRAPKFASELNRMLFLDWQFTLADNDLRKVGRMCAAAGVDVAYPMLGDSLVDFSTMVPSKWKLPRGKLRDFYKQALSGWLPPATINKSKQGFGLPFGVWMREDKRLQELAYDGLMKLRRRDYFKPEFIDNVIKMHREGHASYYGELVWILLVLEYWLADHAEGLIESGS